MQYVFEPIHEGKQDTNNQATIECFLENKFSRSAAKLNNQQTLNTTR